MTAVSVTVAMRNAWVADIPTRQRAPEFRGPLRISWGSLEVTTGNPHSGSGGSPGFKERLTGGGRARREHSTVADERSESATVPSPHL